MVGGKRPDLAAEIAPREYPEAVEHLRVWFNELRRTRARDMNGPLPFSYPMIESWARLTGREPEPREIDALFLLDYVERNPDALKGDA